MVCALRARVAGDDEVRLDHRRHARLADRQPVMRVTGNRLIDNAAAATSRSQSRLSDISDEVSSGLRVSKPSQDPAAWLAAHRTELHKALSEGTKQAMQLSRDRLD